MTIRRMTELDLPAVMRNEQAAYDFPCSASNMANNLKRYYCIVFEMENKEQVTPEVVGHAILSTVLDEASVINIAVSPQAQRKHIGFQMLEHLLKYAESKQCVEVFLEVRESNRPAFTLYHQFGFNEVGIRRGYYPAQNGSEDAILLACYL